MKARDFMVALETIDSQICALSARETAPTDLSFYFSISDRP